MLLVLLSSCQEKMICRRREEKENTNIEESLTVKKKGKVEGKEK
jgi:hypothetical protein